MSCNWGTELWDQFDNLEKHTSCGIDFLERYSKFLRERADIELSYAKQIRYSWCVAFAATLRQLNELSVQREEFAENLNTQIVCELTRYTQEVKTERKNHFQDGRRAQQHIEGSWKQLESSKRRFERDCKEAERAQQVSDRIDLDNKTDGEKARQTAQQKKQAAEESRKDYVTSLNQFNQDQHQHYHTLVPVIYQDMEERRIERVCEAMRSSAEAERKVLPAAGRSLEVMMEAAEGIQPRMVRSLPVVVEVYKSGFDPPDDDNDDEEEDDDDEDGDDDDEDGDDEDGDDDDGDDNDDDDDGDDGDGDDDDGDNDDVDDGGDDDDGHSDDGEYGDDDDGEYDDDDGVAGLWSCRLQSSSS
ncbi:Formin-binding protein 1 [Dissostichus eleginoides]|uniref:Formin-binding protein 1 n=1 Tax=Dissostichus eleginoides TaxID=100907 RepID=A0AAD9B2Q3_DISEL|nr:Formin-binding protein 1 [Dissostichus eleginoides]